MPPDETATPAPETSESTSRGSEFSKPTGAGDEALWDKHFGKDAPEPKAKTKGSKDSESPRTRSDSKPSASTRDATGGKNDPPTTPKDSKSKKDESSTKETKAKDGKAKDSSDPAGGKTASKDKDEPADPEAPSKKARDLFQAAKKTEDRREARKLYKRAMVEAFGEVPEEFDDKRYVAVRTERAAANKAIDDRKADVESRFVKAKEALKAPIYVMRQLEGAGLVDKLTVPFVERAIHVMKALSSLEGGDFTQLAEVVARASGVDHDEAMKRFVRGVKVSPEGKASREAAARAEQRAAQAEQRLQQLEQRLTAEKTTQTEAQKKAEHTQRVEAHRAQYLDDLTTELEGHPVLQLPNGAKRVMAYLIRTATANKTQRYSFEEAANRIVRHERARVQSSRFLVDGEPPPARSEPRRIGSTSRTETVDAGVRSADPVARFNEIFDRHASGGRRR